MMGKGAEVGRGGVLKPQEEEMRMSESILRQMESPSWSQVLLHTTVILLCEVKKKKWVEAQVRWFMVCVLGRKWVFVLKVGKITSREGLFNNNSNKGQ